MSTQDTSTTSTPAPEPEKVSGPGCAESTGSALTAYIVQTALGFTYYSGSRMDCAEEMIREAGITVEEIRKYGGEHAQRLIALLPNNEITNSDPKKA